ncbi:MAG: cold shock domain-containing protein [Magnetococcales bacterium]|nr:cold shock domain-containing protein [Magnetococcales bacterium]
MITTPYKTFFCTRIYNADLLKTALAEADWARFLTEFYGIARKNIRQQQGEIVRSLGDGLLAVFGQPAAAVQAAIDTQESLGKQLPYAETGISCKMGIATGSFIQLTVDEGLFDYLGTAVQIAQHLCEQAYGNAILLHHAPMQPHELFAIHSQAGIRQQRPLEAYFVEQPPCLLQGIPLPVCSHAIFWQAAPNHYLTDRPMETCRAKKEEPSAVETVHFGKVTAFKKERGFGFIQYYTEHHEYKEIYFHMSYVVGNAGIQENDHVQFVIKPGKEERPQACSVLVMGGRLIGQVESLAADGSGHISIRNQASEVTRFFVLPQVIRDLPLRVNDVVEFVVGSGSDAEGLIATDITLHRGEKLAHQAETGDNLTLGNTEQAIVTVYFADKGYGFAKCRRNNIYIHVSELTDPEQTPTPGDLIEFEVTPGRDSTYRANSVRFVQRRDAV